MDRYYNHVYGLGCHRSLPDYNRMEKAQERIWAARLPQIICKDAIARLPSLKSVVFSDWRELARSGESYDECAFRLFGNTLAPCIPRSGDFKIISELHFVLHAVAANPRIDSFSTGSSLLGNPTTMEEAPSIDECQSASVGIPILLQVLTPPRPKFVNLRRLSLRISIEVAWLQAFVPLQLNEFGLREMLMSMSDLMHLSLSLALPHTATDLGHHDILGNEMFRALFSEFHSVNLATLRLERWPLFTNILKGVLKKHSSTLRILKLSNCSLHGSVRSLAEWAGTGLQLDGVNFSGSHELSLEETPIPMEHMEHLWLAEWKNFVVPDLHTKVAGYSSDGKEYEDDSQRPWWTKKHVWE